MNELFTEAEIARVITPPAIPVNREPFCIVAYWRRGNHWKISKTLFPSDDSPAIQVKIKDLVDRGWEYVHIVKLPEYKSK